MSCATAGGAEQSGGEEPFCKGHLLLLAMTKEELLAAAERMQLCLDNLATLFGLHRATGFRYANGM